MVTRVFVEKRKGFDVEARHMMADLRQNLGLKAIEDLRILNRYDVSGLSGEEFEAAARTILSEPNVDNVYDENYKISSEYHVFATEFLPGQYDQRADSASQCVQLLTQGERPQHCNTCFSARLQYRGRSKCPTRCPLPRSRRTQAAGTAQAPQSAA